MTNLTKNPAPIASLLRMTRNTIRSIQFSEFFLGDEKSDCRWKGLPSSLLAIKDWESVDRAEAARLVQVKRICVCARYGERHRLVAQAAEF